MTTEATITLLFDAGKKLVEIMKEEDKDLTLDEDLLKKEMEMNIYEKVKEKAGK